MRSQESCMRKESYVHADLCMYLHMYSYSYNMLLLRLRVMRLILNIIFSGVIVILAYKSTTAFRFTSWLLSVMNKGIKD